MPTVSVIIPAYNHEKYIAETIQSVLTQTYQDFEIIVVDDGSSDGTVAAVKKIKDSRIRLFAFEQNQGACVATEKCIAEATGQYIAMLSSDDIFLPEKLEKQVAFLEKNQGIGAVFSYAEIIDEEGQIFSNKEHFYCHIFEQPNRNRHEWLRYFFFQGNCLCHPSMLIRCNCYKEIGIYDARYRQLPDLDFWVRLCLKYEIFILPERLIQFRIRSQNANASAWTPANQVRDAFEQIAVLDNYLKLEPEEFLVVFPEVDASAISSDLLPYQLACQALKKNEGGSRLFALKLLYELLGDAQKAKKLQDTIGFTYNDFFGLTGELDIFKLFKKYDTRLYLDSGDGFTEASSIVLTEQFIAGSFALEFSLTEQWIDNFRWDPLEGDFCYIKLESIAYEDMGGDWKSVLPEQLETNGKKRESGDIFFYTVDPMVLIPIKNTVKKIRLRGQWGITTTTTLDHFLIEQDNQLEEKERLLKECEARLKEIHQSRGWKIILKIRKVKQLCRQFFT